MVKKSGGTDPDDKKSLKENPEEHEHDIIYEQIVWGRANIGARNPLDLAASKVSSLADPPYTGTYLRALLEEAFEDLPYERLFDPAYGSLVYYGIYPATARLAECPQIGGLYAEELSVLGEDRARNPGQGAVHPDCPNRVKSNTQYSTINGHQLQYRDTTVAPPTSGIEFNDPVQGCLADCWLIAALSSAALFDSVALPPVKKIRQAPPVKVYPPSDFTHMHDLTTANEYYTARNQTIPYFGGLNPKKPIPPADIYESWPCYYEKCFARYYSLNRVPPFTQDNNPNYLSLNFRGTFAALADITGKYVTTATSAMTRDYLGATVATDRDAALIERIRTGACNSGALSPNGVVLYTKRPTVAYTYVSASYVPPNANLPAKQYTPATVVYDCLGIPANHAFSVVGLYQKDGIKYVVLRNPWGIAGDAASFSQSLRGSLASGLVSLPVPYNTIAGIATEGIFGLNSVTFMRYFEAVGWTLVV